MAVRSDFAVATTVISDHSKNIITAATLKLPFTDALLGEASAALLTTKLAVSTGIGNFFLERDALLVILAINRQLMFSSWNFANIILDIGLGLLFFSKLECFESF